MSEFYRQSHRALQEELGSVPLADALAATIVVNQLDDDAAAFVASRDFMFLSTVDATGNPTVSHKGGAPGFVRVENPTTLMFPSYDGNGMYLSMGNIAETGRIGLLFMDFATPHRVRVQASASISRDGDDLARFPGAQLVVRAEITEAFVNCGRYIHSHKRVASSPYVPDDSGEAPVPAWKRIDLLQSALSEQDQARAAQAGTIDFDEYAQRVERGDP